jgi:hypothetical protein
VTDCIIQSNELTGTLQVKGLNIGGRITSVSINDSSWTPLPAIPLANRNAMSIQNSSGVEIKINYDSTVATYFGVRLTPDTERYYDITDSISIFAKASPGSGTVSIIIEELA